MRDVENYDFTKIPAECREEVRHLTIQIRASFRSSTERNIEAGKALIAVKSKLKRGEFATYCVEALYLNPRMAQHYMCLAKLADRLGEEVVSQVPPGVAYKLAAKDADSEVVQAILAEIAAGNIPTIAIVVERMKDAKDAGARRRHGEISSEEIDRLAFMLTSALSSAQLAAFVGFLADAKSSAIGELGRKCGLLGGATEAPVVPRPLPQTVFG